MGMLDRKIKKQSTEKLVRSFNLTSIMFCIFFLMGLTLFFIGLHTMLAKVFMVGLFYFIMSIIFFVDVGVTLIQLEIRDKN